MKKYLVIAASFATLLAGSTLSASPAQASWAESAQSNPVYTGTNRSLYRSERAQRHYSYPYARGYLGHPGYSAYGAYDGGYYGSYGPYDSGYGYYRY